MAISELIDEPHLPPKEVADGLHTEVVHASLALLEALLNVEGEIGSKSELFAALREVFLYDQALVLEIRGDEFESTASVPSELMGRRWPKAALQNVLSGRILVNSGDRHASAFPFVLSEQWSPTQPTLFFPIGVRGSPAVLVLLLAQGREAFGDGLVAIARQCAVVALAALAARYGNRREAEIARLHHLVEQLRRGEQSARRDNRLLQELMDHLPIGVTGQDTNGRFILVNATAAANLAT